MGALQKYVWGMRGKHDLPFMLFPSAGFRAIKSRASPTFYCAIFCGYYSPVVSAVGAEEISGRSTNSISAIGALSPTRKPYFRIRM